MTVSIFPMSTLLDFASVAIIRANSSVYALKQNSQLIVN